MLDTDTFVHWMWYQVSHSSEHIQLAVSKSCLHTGHSTLIRDRKGFKLSLKICTAIIASWRFFLPFFLGSLAYLVSLSFLFFLYVISLCFLLLPFIFFSIFLCFGILFLFGFQTLMNFRHLLCTQLYYLYPPFFFYEILFRLREGQMSLRISEDLPALLLDSIQETLKWTKKKLLIQECNINTMYHSSPHGV